MIVKRLTSMINDHISWLDSQDARELSTKWQQIIDYMWQEDRTHLLSEFARTMNNQDRYRNESFHNILPQFADLIPVIA